MVQEQRTRSKTRGSDDHAEVSHKDVSNKELAEAVDATVSDIDDVLEDQLDEELLADIDDVLESNAREFVENYVQQGGE